MTYSRGLLLKREAIELSDWSHVIFVRICFFREVKLWGELLE